MKNAIVRLVGLELRNFKNVKYGTLSFFNNRRPNGASVLGLYGQNGSGKTALIDSISLLKLLLSGKSIPERFGHYICVDSEYASLKYEFLVTDVNTNEKNTVIYEVSLKKAFDTQSHNSKTEEPNDGHFVVSIQDEVLSYSCLCSNGKTKVLPVIDTRNSNLFGPKSKLQLLINSNDEAITDLIVAKKLAMATSKSYVFSRDFLDIIRQNCKENYHKFIIESLVNYGNFELFVIDTSNAGLISMDALPIAFKYESKSKAAFGNMMIPLNKPELIPEEAFSVAKKVIDDMNIVLEKIIPGLTISIENLGAELLRNGKNGVRVQLISHKNNKPISLKYESEGIKKIISILHLMIVVFNKSSITVAIDELDSGIFEYLLGELLRIISENGSGQLIFTSHNLRPLETLDRGFIAFTTTNPENRYIRMSNVKANNNLRDFYYRDIMLGEQAEEVYEPTNNYEIAFAFQEAGESIGS